MKRKLFKFAILCASVFMLPMGAWADNTVTWTFTSWSDATKTALATDAATNGNAGTLWVSETKGYGYKPSANSSAATNVALQTSDGTTETAITELNELTFDYPKAGATRIKIITKESENSLFFVSAKEKVNVPVSAGKKVTISSSSYSSSYNNRIECETPGVVAYNQTDASSGSRTDVFIVTGNVTTATFNGSESHGVYLYSITVSDASAVELLNARFGTDDYITATTEWTFDQYSDGAIIVDYSTGLNYAGLYMKSHNSSGKENTAGVLNSENAGGYAAPKNYCSVKGEGNSNLTAADLQTSKASDYKEDCMAINIATPGTLYAKVSAAGTDRSVSIYKGNSASNTGAETLSDLILTDATATISAKNTIYEITATISEAGTYWITGTKAYYINAIKFVPTTATAMTKTVTLTAAGGGYATFSAPQSYVVPDGVTAYYVSAVNETEATTTSITAGNVIPACTGVILYKSGVSSDTEIKLTSSESYTPVTNSMMPNLAAYALQNNDGTNYNYTLAYDGGPVFKHSSGEGTTLAAGKAFLRTTVNVTGGSSSARSIKLVFGSDVITGISQKEAVNVKKENDGIYYNLSGQRVINPTKGLYIVNGKKVFIN